MPIPVPHLRDKLALLYKSGRNPAISSAASLAKEIGVVPAQVTNWINGNAGMQESALPDAKLQPLCQLFALNIEDLLTPNLEHFKTLIARPYSGWKRLLDRAVPFDDQNRIGLALKHRGLAFQSGEDDLKGEPYRLGEPFRLELSGPAGWHVIVLVRDPETVTCWCPSQYFPDNRLLADGMLSIPAADQPALSVTPPLGQHWLLTVYTEKRLPELLYQQLYDDLPMNRELAINSLEQALNYKDVGQWLALRKAFYVTD
jgi:hypothetical protein